MTDNIDIKRNRARFAQALWAAGGLAGLALLLIIITAGRAWSNHADVSGQADCDGTVTWQATSAEDEAGTVTASTRDLFTGQSFPAGGGTLTASETLPPGTHTIAVTVTWVRPENAGPKWVAVSTRKGTVTVPTGCPEPTPTPTPTPTPSPTSTPTATTEPTPESSPSPSGPHPPRDTLPAAPNKAPETSSTSLTCQVLSPGVARWVLETWHGNELVSRVDRGACESIEEGM